MQPEIWFAQVKWITLLIISFLAITVITLITARTLVRCLPLSTENTRNNWFLHSRGCGVSVPLSRLWWCEVWSPAPSLGRGSLPRWPASWPRDTGHRDNYNNKHQVSSTLAHCLFLILWPLTPLFPILSFRASPWSRPTCSLDEWHYCESIKLQIFHKTCDRIS